MKLFDNGRVFPNPLKEVFMLFRKEFVVGALSCAFATSAFAGAKPTKAEMIKFVDEAVAHVQKVGKDAAIKEFNDQKGKFWKYDGELYIFAYTMDGTNLALPAKPALIGKNLIGLKDAKGNPLIQALRDGTQKNGKFNYEWMWENPASKKVEPKEGYAVKIVDPKGDWFLGSGIYKP
jgi:polar amino acid transport system substrate-binding protein